MQLECPHCQAKYDIDQAIGDAAFVCHCCGQTFNPEAPATEHAPEPAQNRGLDHLPPRKTTHLWPWFLTMLLLLIGSGFWIQQDAWLDNRWFRSTLMNVGIDLPMRSKDWRIAPESVQSTWITRKDGSRILFVHGRIDNLMRSDLPLPRIEFTFFSQIDPRKQLERTVLPIRFTPSDQALHLAPYVPPLRDTILVPAQSTREFAIVVESVPKETGDFTLMPALP